MLFGFTVAQAQVLEEIVVTAQKREVGLQSAPVAISALTGEALAKRRIFSVDDLAASVASLGLTGGNSPVDLELNTAHHQHQLDFASGEAAVGTLSDEIYIGAWRMNTDSTISTHRGESVAAGRAEARAFSGRLNIVTARRIRETPGRVTVGVRTTTTPA